MSRTEGFRITSRRSITGGSRTSEGEIRRRNRLLRPARAVEIDQCPAGCSRNFTPHAWVCRHTTRLLYTECQERADRREEDGDKHDPPFTVRGHTRGYYISGACARNSRRSYFGRPWPRSTSHCGGQQRRP